MNKNNIRARAQTTGRATRRALLAGAAGATSFVILRWPANAAQFTYKLGHDQPVSHPQNVRAVEAAANITKESGGRLTVEVFPNNQLGGDTQMLAQLRSGALELLQIGDNILANVVPSASVAGIPFAYKDYDQLWSTLDGELGRYIHAQIEKAGLHVFDKAWDAGFRQVFTSDHAVNAPADMKGLKLRVPEAPIQLSTFRAFGASPTPINNSELYTALQTHLVDGAEQPLVSIESARYYEVTKYITMTRHQPTPFEMLANGNAWRRLPPDLQEILSRNLNESALRERSDVAHGEVALQAHLKTQGQAIIEPDHAAFQNVIRSAGLYAQWRDTYGAEPFALLEKSVGKLT
jgi:tripartite ATP-independent transporter DctP family solute receptor